MVLSPLAILAGSMFAVALVFSMLGQGGGTLYTPLQVWLGIDFHVAATTSLFLIMTTSLSATLVFRKARRVDWPLAITLETVTTLGGLVGGLASGRFSGQILSVCFAVVVAFASLFMIHEFKQAGRVVTGVRPFYVWERHFGEQTYRVNLLIGLSASFVAGLASGLVGVGGGILKVPLMVLLLGVPMDIAVGSSAFMVGMTASGGFAGHLIAGHWDWRISLILAVAVFIGGQIGPRLTLKVNKDTLKKGFGWFLLAIAALMVVKALG
jgi:uncharacterized membrane protein YfcA